jgi:hypothetical protein
MNADDHRSWRFCPLCSLALVESKLLAKEPEEFISFLVACGSGHSFVLTEDPRHREVTLRAWAQGGAR